MPSRLSDAQANNALDVRFGAVASNAPATYYFALCTTAPSTNTGTSLVEPSTGAYARVAISNNPTSFPAAAARAKANGVPITWPTATAGWGTIVGVAMFDALTAGTFLGYGALGTPVAVASGAAPQVNVGNFTVTSDGS